MPVTRSINSYSVDNTATASAPTTTETSPSEQKPRHTNHRSNHRNRSNAANSRNRRNQRCNCVQRSTGGLDIPTTTYHTKGHEDAAAKSNRKDLVKAREELLALKVKLAAARVAALEEDDTDVEEDFEESTVREERTTEWIRKSTMALTLEPHHEAADIETKRECRRRLPHCSGCCYSCVSEPVLHWELLNQFMKNVYIDCSLKGKKQKIFLLRSLPHWSGCCYSCFRACVTLGDPESVYEECLL